MSERNGSTDDPIVASSPRKRGGFTVTILVLVGILALAYALNPALALVPVGLLLLVLLHWLLWGRRLTADLQEERQKLLEAEREQAGHQDPSTPWERRF